MLPYFRPHSSIIINALIAIQRDIKWIDVDLWSQLSPFDENYKATNINQTNWTLKTSLLQLHIRFYGFISLYCFPIYFYCYFCFCRCVSRERYFYM